MKRQTLLNETVNYLTDQLSISIEDFYSINIWSGNEIKLQGQYNNKMVSSLFAKGLNPVCSANGYIDCNIAIEVNTGKSLESMVISIILT